MYKTRIALAVLVAAGVVGTLAPWYTGMQLEEVLQTSIRQGNEQLQDSVPGAGVSMELVAVERGFFTSTAHYRLTLDDTSSGEAPTVLRFSDHIEHGPLPLSRLQSLELKPVMATSRFELERSEDVIPWFVGAGGSSPLTGSLVLNYDNSVTGRVTLLPLQLAGEGNSVRFSGMDLEVAAGAQSEYLRLAGGMDSLSLDLNRDGEPLQLQLKGLSLRSDYRLGQSGLYTGDSRLALQQVQLLQAGKPPVEVRDFVQADRLEELGGQMKGAVGYDIGMLSYGGQPLGSLNLSLSLANLDVLALKNLGDWYTGLLRRLQTQPDGDTGLSAEEQDGLQAGLGALLAGQPKLALDNLSLKTANGESRFSLMVDLARPVSYELPPAELARQLVGKLDVHLVLAKPMIRDVVMYQAALDPAGDPAAAALEATQLAEMADEMASSLQFARVEGDNIVASLSYADGQIEFNGQTLPAEQFAGLLLSVAPAEAMGLMMDGEEGAAAGDRQAQPGADRGAMATDSAVEPR
ncbi:YdgA family protein [Pseudomonas sp. MAP12]|uniref:YdgA family protein n=1 Tax=Geopseudomonas aromaticivorans TaxID=2849492 RepID=A0ABS6MW71_9GAMM|nr:YdgA family protein [Pseudomonas aromaticivorans]MBV2133053.1 YdgA family protein [Pseudomonas aromaticivorans]